MKVLRNRYELESKMKDGGMARIYKALDHFTRKHVVIKENILSENSTDNEMIQRLQREFYFLSKIDHPNIVKGVDLFELKNRYLLVMEYVDGVTLSDFIRKQKKSISLEKQLEICIQICDAVSTLNKSNVIHRDLKPSNIMLTSNNNTPKLLDLGIAKSTQDELPKLTEPGKMLGTKAYMSPEQIRGESTKKSDTFSLAVLFYQFLAWQEKSPFSEGNSVSTIYKVTYEEIPLLSEAIEETSTIYDNLGNILSKALKKNTDERISTEELAKLLCQEKLPQKLKKITKKIKRSKEQDEMIKSAKETRKKNIQERNKKRINKLAQIYSVIFFLLILLISAYFFYVFKYH